MTRSNHHPPRPILALSVGITGHRPPLLSSEAADMAHERLNRVFRILAAATAALRDKNPDLFSETPFVPCLVSALAEGADQIAAETALDVGYALQVVLPMPRDEYRKDFSEAAAVRFDSLLERADRAFELPLQAGGREEGYPLVGRATVAHSDVLVALWDGEPARGPGGTAEVVALAVRRGIPVLHLPIDETDETRILWTGYGDFIDSADLDSVPMRVADEGNLTDLVNTLLGPPDTVGEAENLRKYLLEREQLLRPRAEYPILLAALGIKRLRRSAFVGQRYREATRAEWQAFHDALGGGQHGVTAELDGIETTFAWADRLAQHFAQSYRSGHVLNFTLGAAAVLIALTGLLFPKLEFWAALCESAAITGFVINTAIGTRQQWHRRWLEYRQLAERIRPMRSLKLLGVAAPPGPSHGEGHVRRWADWYASAQWRAAGCPSGMIEDTDTLTRAIIQEEIKPQLDYHRASAKQMHHLDHRLHKIGMMLLVGSVLGCFSSVTANLVAHDFAVANAHVFIALSAGLPAMGAAIFGIRMQGDFGASAERSLITASNLERVVEALERPGIGLGRQTSLAEAAASTMLAELDDWHHAYAQRRLELP